MFTIVYYYFLLNDDRKVLNLHHIYPNISIYTIFTPYLPIIYYIFTYIYSEGRERESVYGGRNCQKQLLSDQIYLDLNYTVFTLVLH